MKGRVLLGKSNGPWRTDLASLSCSFSIKGFSENQIKSCKATCLLSTIPYLKETSSTGGYRFFGGLWRTPGGFMPRSTSQNFCCQCPCPCGEPQPPPTSAGDPPTLADKFSKCPLPISSIKARVEGSWPSISNQAESTIWAQEQIVLEKQQRH